MSFAMLKQNSWKIVDAALRKINPPPWKKITRGSFSED
jgi:hypothetical protein